MNQTELLTAVDWLNESVNAAVVPWIRQAGFLFKADVAWLTGNRVGAFEAITEARRLSTRPLAVTFSGPMARWTTLLCLRNNKLEEALELLAYLDGQLDRLDALDRVEVLTCLALVEMRPSGLIGDAADRARQELSRLPTQCAQRLADLGLVLPHGGAKALPKAALGA